MVIRFILLVAVYVLCTWYAEAFIKGPGQVTIFWPAAGVAFAAVLRYGWRMSFFIPVAVVLAHGWFVPVPTSFLPFSIASNWIGSLAGTWVALRVGPPQITVTSGFGMLRGGVVMVLVSAAIGSVGLVVSGMVPAANALPAFVRWSMGDLLGILCVSPLLLVVTRPPTTHPDIPRVADFAAPGEIAIWAVGLLVSFAVLYLGGRHAGAYALGITAVPLSLLLWSAFRFEPTWTAIGTCVCVLILTSLTGLGLAGFRPPVDTLDVVLLLGFMTLFATIPLALAASVYQQRMSTRKNLRHAIRDAAVQREVLEQQVHERTQELHETNRLLEAANDRLETVSQTDPLTGLRNRRYLANQMRADLSFYDRELLRGGRSDHALLFALIDLDHFKRINDSLGHKAGDEVLQQCARILAALVREGDYVMRWGGEEFLLVFRPIPRGFVRMLGERIRRSISEHPFTLEDGTVLHVTVSVGLSEYPLFRDAAHVLGWEQMLELADAALYWVKHRGRDGWAALRPTEETRMETLMDGLKQGAEALIDSGQLTVTTSKDDGAAAP